MRLLLAHDELKLAQLEHNSQLIIHQVKKVNNLIANAWYELEILRQDFRDLSKAYGELNLAKELHNERQ